MAAASFILRMNSDWAYLAPDIVNLIVYILTEGVFMAFADDPERHGRIVSTRIKRQDTRFDHPSYRPPPTLTSQLYALNKLARVCRAWFESINWHLVYAQIPQDSIQVRDLREVPHDRCSRALMHGVVCASLALHPPRLRRFIDLDTRYVWSDSLEWQSDFGYVWGDDARRLRRDIRETDFLWCNSNGLTRDRNMEIYFMSDLRAAAFTEEERRVLTSFDYDSRMAIVTRHGFKHRYGIKRVWISDMGWQRPWSIPHTSIIRAALMAWRDSEDALNAVREQVRTLRKKRPRDEREGEKGTKEIREKKRHKRH